MQTPSPIPQPELDIPAPVHEVRDHSALKKSLAAGGAFLAGAFVSTLVAHPNEFDPSNIRVVVNGVPQETHTIDSLTGEPIQSQQEKANQIKRAGEIAVPVLGALALGNFVYYREKKKALPHPKKSS